MPFTPYHMGPGILIKSAMRGAFSLVIFGWSQILIDLEPLVAITTGWGRLHGYSHTFLGATAIGLLAAWTGKHLMGFAWSVLQLERSWPLFVPWRVAIASAFIGTYSHVILDSIMHFDVEPFAPFSAASPLIRIISVPRLHDLCVFSGLVGALIYFAVGLWLWQKQRRQAK